VVAWYASVQKSTVVRSTLEDIIDTPISPELIPAHENGEIKQKTEDLVGPYELHDFFLYHILRHGFRPSKIYMLARHAFAQSDYDDETIKKWLSVCYRRFFNQ
jgi:NAD+ synthase (glutamine-hydrolysing)